MWIIIAFIVVHTCAHNSFRIDTLNAFYNRPYYFFDTVIFGWGAQRLHTMITQQFAI